MSMTTHGAGLGLIAVMWLLLLMMVGSQPCAAEDGYTHVRDVVYGRKFGMSLTMDVLKPPVPSGIGVLYLMSGGWASNYDVVGDGSYWKALTQRGQTVFLVCHGSRPRFTMSEIVGDLRRAVRFVRTHAAEYGVDPDRIGIAGMSSGGHLSCTIGTMPEAGDPAAKDPVDRVSSRVGAVACFFPPLDFVNYGAPGRTVLDDSPIGPAIRELLEVNGKSKNEELQALRAFSPYWAATAETPPILILQGDKDNLVPYEQAERFMAKLEELKVPHGLIMRPGFGHGWDGTGRDLELFAAWFDIWLAKRSK